MGMLNDSFKRSCSAILASFRDSQQGPTSPLLNMFKSVVSHVGHSFKPSSPIPVEKATRIDVSVDWSRPIDNISSLFISAQGTYRVFLSVVQDLAAGCRGMFQVDGEVQDMPFAVWSEAPMGTKFKFASLKHTTRAIEKCWRIYQGDVSRLLDVCRQCIVFDNLEDLCRCVLLIERSKDVVVERVKNRMSPKWDSKSQGGYRDVLFNLRVVNEEAMRERVYHHVCELQLILWEFASLKTDMGHTRYRVSRNMRGE